MTAPPPPAHPPPSVRTVGIVAKTHLENAASVVADITAWLNDRGLTTILEAETARGANRSDESTFSTEALAAHVDLVLVLGGDGTLLGVARGVAAGERDVPVLPVNLGSLGFLTEITLPELYDALESVIAGTAGLDERQMLRVVVTRGDDTLEERLVLNDVVISKGALSNIIELAVTVGNQFVTRVRADGLIAASPTGSTAYSMAAGGPIVHPKVDAILLTPIAPHTLTNRPIVIPSTTAVHIKPVLDVAHRSAYVSFDGQSGFELQAGDHVHVERSRRPLHVIRADARNYFAVLREKLKWGEQ